MVRNEELVLHNSSRFLLDNFSIGYFFIFVKCWEIFGNDLKMGSGEKGIYFYEVIKNM